MKTCSKCGMEYPATTEYFYTDKRNKNRLCSHCKSCMNEDAKLRQEKNKDKKAEYDKTRYLNNKEKIDERNKKYNANPECRRRYYEKNKEKMKECAKIHYLNNKEKYYIKCGLRRSRESQLPATLTAKQWTRIKEYFDNGCAYCGAEVALTQDHLIALVSGGGYTAENIIPACRSCNCSKHTSKFEDWYPRQSFYDAEREQKILQIGAMS